MGDMERPLTPALSHRMGEGEGLAARSCRLSCRLRCITYGLPALSPIPETYEALQEVWDNLGPPPEILYDKLPQER